MPDASSPKECAGIASRREVTEGIRDACSPGGDSTPIMGTDAELERYFGILSGIVAEYRDGGDQITELCDCGEHDNHDPDPYSTATAGIKEAIRKALVDQAHMNDTEAGILITMEELLRRLDNA